MNTTTFKVNKKPSTFALLVRQELQLARMDLKQEAHHIRLVRWHVSRVRAYINAFITLCKGVFNGTR
jgi:hypothetical protein